MAKKNRVDILERAYALEKEVQAGNLDIKGYGTKSDTLKFEFSVFDDLVKPLANGKVTVIGHCFTSTETISVPVLKFKEDAQHRYDVEESVEWRVVNAGDLIVLNYIEMAILLSQPEYNGVASGGDIMFELRLSAPRGDTDKPTPAFRLCRDNSVVLAQSASKPVGQKKKSGYVLSKEYGSTFERYMMSVHSCHFKGSKARKNADRAKINKIAMSEAFLSAYDGSK